VGEGSSRNPPPPTTTKRIVHREFPKGRMHIDMDIEEEEEHNVSSSEDDDVEDETYRISPRAASDNDDDEELEDVEDEPIRQVEDEEGEGNEGIGNPQQRGRVPFPRKLQCNLLLRQRYNKGSEEALED
jgi:hypothetical protein